MSDSPTPYDGVPEVSPRVRSTVYLVGAIVSFVAFVTGGSAAVLMDDPVAVVTISGLIGSGFGGFAASLGVAYRPTR